METLKEKYAGKLLSTDEVAVARTEIDKLTKELEQIDYKTGPDHILFKWGTLKGWELTSEKGKELLKKYHEIGSSLSAMAQNDTTEQKQLICEMIDECDGILQSDWTGEYFTKQQAKDYILEHKVKTD